jgi:hypothetical protein
MKITNRKLRKEFAQPGHCEICNVWCRKREGHHLWHRTPELTIRINLISLGSTQLFCCPCHHDIGIGKIPASRVMEIVAAREKCNPEDIREVLYWMRRLIKPTARQLEIALEDLSEAARMIALKELAEAGEKKPRREKPLTRRRAVS